MNIMLGGNGHAVPSCRMKAPIPQHRNDAIIYTMSEALKKPFFHYRALCVNGDFHNYVALNTAGQF